MRVMLQSGKAGEVDDALVQKLAKSFRGELFAPPTAGYEDARHVFNAAVDKKPALVARCRTVADVILAVQFAREHGILTSLRGGGHDIAGKSICDGGLVIDQSRMTAVHVSPAKRTMRVEAGATWAHVDRETTVFQLATPGGTISKVGVAGFTLGGGIGWLSRKHGLACDNVLSIDVVTAQGKLVTASRQENNDLFWALRGGGGNFGVVTSFEMQLHGIKPPFGGLLVYPVKQAREVLEKYRELVRTAPDDLAAYASLLVHPQAGPVVAVAGAYFGNAVDGQAMLADLRALKPMVDGWRPLSYLELQGMLDESAPEGFHHSWRACYAQSLSDRGIATLVEHFGKLPAGCACQVLIEHLGGAIARSGRTDSAYAHRDAVFSMLFMGSAPDETVARSAAAWTKRTFDAMRPMMSDSVYVNYLSHEADEDERLPLAYDTQTLRQLAAVKAKVDPDNFFHHNHNVKPGGDEPARVGRSDDELRRLVESLLARFDALEERVMELEFETTLSDKPPRKKDG